MRVKNKKEMPYDLNVDVQNSTSDFCINELKNVIFSDKKL